MINIKIKREQEKNWLIEQINAVIRNTDFTLSKLESDYNNFGNVMVELSNHSYTFRVVRDRGDIYVDKRKNNSATWNSQHLMYDNIETEGDSYATLIKAMQQIVHM